VEKITDYVMHLPEKAWVYMLNNQEEVLWAINDANCKLKQINGGHTKVFARHPSGSSGRRYRSQSFRGSGSSTTDPRNNLSRKHNKIILEDIK